MKTSFGELKNRYKQTITELELQSQVYISETNCDATN